MKYFFISSAFIGNLINLIINYPVYLMNKFKDYMSLQLGIVVLVLLILSAYYLNLGYTSPFFYFLSIFSFLLFILFLGYFLNFIKPTPYFNLKKYVTDGSEFYSETSSSLREGEPNNDDLIKANKLHVFFKQENLLPKILKLLNDNDFFPKEGSLKPIELNILILKLENLNLFKYNSVQKDLVLSVQYQFKIYYGHENYSKLKTAFNNECFSEINNERFSKLKYLNVLTNSEILGQ